MAARHGWGATSGLLLTLGLGVVIGAPAWSAGGGGGGGGGGGSSSARDQAVLHYKKGEKYRDAALAFETQAEAATDDDAREEAREDAEKKYRRALREFTKASRKDRKFFFAFNEIGFVKRKLGDYEGALEAYDRALKIEPRFAQAIEYRGEAYLELGRLGDAKSAYMQLFGSQRDLADMLLEKMHRWVERRRSDPDGLEPEAIEAFAAWVDERSEIARQTARIDASDGAVRW